MSDNSTDSTVPVMFARLEAKLDVALAQHGAKLDKHDEDLRTVNGRVDDHENRIRTGEARTVVTPKMLLGVLGTLAALVAMLTPFLDKLYGG